MTDDEIIAVVQANKEGKRIQFRNSCCDWEEFVGAAAVWCFCGREFRVAHEPRKPREWMMGEDIDGNLVNSSMYGGGRTIRVREVIE